MDNLGQIKKNIAKAINQNLGKNLVNQEAIVYPPEKNMGDLSLPCFNLAKTLKKNPAQIAEELKKQLKAEEYIAHIENTGAYLNFFLNKTFLTQQIIEAILENKHYPEVKDKKEKILIEYSNVNTHKEYHVGHLRNICLGEAVKRILNANNQQAVPLSYLNDFGIHTAKTIWYLQKLYQGEKNENLLKLLKPFIKDGEEEKTFSQILAGLPQEKKGFALGKIYSEAARASKGNPEAEAEIKKIMRKIESRKNKEYKLWQKTREWSLKEFAKIYADLGVKFEKTFYESDLIKKGEKMVNKLLAKGILEKSQGAVIANLEKYNLGVLIFIRSDGTKTYPVADLPLAQTKLKKYKPDKSIYVVDNRQELYFKQLFKILELMGYEQKMIHLSYDFVKLPGGMMSSRSGNVITYTELKEEVVKRAKKEIEQRHPDWAGEKIISQAQIIGLGAIKFEMLKVNSQNIITFDIDKSLSFEGFTSAYIQYTFARINSIIKKSGEEKSSYNPEKLTEEKEQDLIFKLALYPEIVEKAGKKYDPSEIAKYLFELAQKFNDYYHSVPVLKAEEETKTARLKLLQATQTIIKKGLALLAIE